ncbi:MerR family transcriptional regulator [Shimazuella sp. AN120528]|uniref:MerR family transcriptional regulator n=1 Tax=Shimazuella soli TaxID=1892854 RepID=UPI001F0FDB8B|nr:MerR family transcriptional regulator [Shimazuella soli]MCH5584446.1 MerR family transcriptional regulator [Shimazuella soli]
MSEHPSNEEWLFDYQLLSKLVIGIGEVSDITGLPTRKIRYWEDKGIIQSKKDCEGGTRKYSYLDIKKIILIQELLADGYTLDAAAKKVENRIKNINQTMLGLSKYLDQQD